MKISMLRMLVMFLSILVSQESLSGGTIYGGDHVGDDYSVETSGNMDDGGYPAHNHGIYVNLAAEASAGDRLSIVTSGRDADGIRTNPSSSKAQGTIVVGDDLKIITKGISADAANLNGYSNLTIGDRALIRTEYQGDTIGKNGAIGLRANYASRIITGDQLDILTLGTSSHGAWAIGSFFTSRPSSLAFGQNSRIETRGDDARAVYLSGTRAELVSGDGAFWITQGLSSHALAIETSGASVAKLGHFTQLETRGESAHGVSITRAGHLSIGDNLTITTQGRQSDALSLSGTALVDTGARTQILTQGENAYGARLSKTSTLTAGDDFFITTQGQGADAVNLSEGSQLIVGNRAVFQTEYHDPANSSRAVGLHIQPGGHLTAGESLLVNTRGKAAHGAWLAGDVTKRTSSLTTGKSNRIATSGDEAHAVYLSGENIQWVSGEGAYWTTSGQSSHALVIESEGDWSVSLGENTKLSTQGDQSHAVYLNASSHELQLGENSHLSSRGAAAHAILADQKGSQVALTGSTTLVAKGENSYALYARHGDILSSQPVLLDITGNLRSENAGVISLRMGSGSRLDGDAYAVGDKSKIDLFLHDTLWRVNTSSRVNTLTISGNNTLVDLAEDRAGSLLDIGQLNGSDGHFRMRVTANEKLADQLVLHNSSEGRHQIRVIDYHTQQAKGDEVIPIVSTADGIAEFELFNVSARRSAAIDNGTELGGFVYRLRRSSDNSNNWELYGDNTLSPVADASGNFINVGYLLTYAETESLLQRVGELRNGGVTGKGNVWMRAFAGQFDGFGHGKLHDFDMSYSGLQLGGDARKTLMGSPLYLGVAAGMTKGNPHFQGGNADVKGGHLAAYATLLTSRSFYASALIKYTWHKNRLDNVEDVAGNAISGNSKSNGLSINLEGGQRWYLTETQQGMYLEPQVQLNYAYQNASTLQASNGLQVKLGRYHSVLGRGSFLVGYQMSQANVYLMTGYLREMAGSSAYYLNNTKVRHDFGSNGWDNRLGISAQLSKQHHLYLEGTYTTGSLFNRKGINLGYRYEF